MKDRIISYRGAQVKLSELQNQRTDQLQQQQGTRLVQYRGTTFDATVTPQHEKKTVTISYRGATDEVSL